MDYKKNFSRRNFIKYGSIISGAAACRGFLSVVEYADISFIGEQPGRTKNAFSVLLPGLVAQKLYGYAGIDMDVEKSLWLDSKVTGRTTEYSIDTETDLWFASAKFSAVKNKKGMFKGNVEKTEFNWEIMQTAQDKYHVVRKWLKSDADLELKIDYDKDSKLNIITGDYKRGFNEWDWKIEGTHNPDTYKTIIEVSAWATLNFTLNGKITPR